MPRNLHQRASAVLSEALSLSPADREEFIRARCGTDPALLAEALSLLRNIPSGDGTNHSPIDVLGIPASVAATGASLRSGLGDYVLLKELGSGGMGIVYRARQERPIQREVAIKFLMNPLPTASLRARFEGECAALANMEHPHIAKIFDAGTTPLGQPYFVMELVHGTRITDFADRERLGLGDRLRLFAQVCRAVQHAHQRNTIHRDLKPDNILVSSEDGTPNPRIIDFGIAKIVGRSHAEDSLHTKTGTALGTVGYMSPEQTVSSEAIDQRTDVYSLGALLYELLAGTPPFRIAHGMPHDEFFRAIRSTDPQTPSARVGGLGVEGSAVAESRRMPLASLLSALRTDLDWIVMRAIEREPSRRYPSAGEMLQDVERHLRGDPVDARPPTAAYKLTKFLRRHRFVVTAAGVLAALTLAGVIGIVSQAQEARRRLAELERLTTTLVSQLEDLTDTPGKTKAKQTLVRIVAETLESVSSERPRSQALRLDLAEAYRFLGQLRGDPFSASLGDTRQGELDLAKAVSLGEALLAENPEDRVLVRELMESKYLYAVILQTNGRAHPCRREVEEAEALGDRLIGSGPLDLETNLRLADIYEFLGEASSATGTDLMDSGQERALQVRLALYREVPQSALVQRALGTSYLLRSGQAVDPDSALALAREAVALFRRASQKQWFSHRASLGAWYAYLALGTAHMRTAHPESAVTAFTEALRIAEDLCGADSSDLRSRSYLASSHNVRGESFSRAAMADSALDAHRTAISIYRALPEGKEGPVWRLYGLRFSQWHMARAARDAGRLDSARDHYEEVLGLLPKRGLPAKSGLLVGLALDEIAGFFADSDSTGRSIALHRGFASVVDSMYIAIRASGDQGGLPFIDVVGGYMHLAECLWAVDRGVADSLAARACRLAEEHLGATDYWTLLTKAKRIRLLEDMRDPDAYERLSRELEGTLLARAGSDGRGHRGGDRDARRIEWIAREIERVESRFPPSRQISRGGWYPIRKTPPWGDYGQRVLSEERSRCEYQAVERPGFVPGTSAGSARTIGVSNRAF